MTTCEIAHEHHADDGHVTSAAGDPYWQDDDFWAAFDEPYDIENRPRPWYRKFARAFAVIAVAGMIATGALIPWGTLLDRLDNISDPIAVREFAAEVVEESPYGFLVTDIHVRSIDTPEIGGWVSNAPPTGIVTLDLRGWDPDEMRSVVDHEIGHLLDFALWGLPGATSAEVRRGGLDSEPWAECASVNAGSRKTDGGPGDNAYHCTAAELAVFQRVIADLGPICPSWGDLPCVQVEVLPALVENG